MTELAQLQGKALDDPWPQIAQSAAQIGSNDLVVNLSFFDSVGGSSGAIANIREENLTVGHLFHAAFANMAGNYYQSALRIDANQPWRQLVFSGGLAQKITVLQQLIQQQFNRPTRLCPSAEDTMLGLLALGHVATGRITSVSAAIHYLAEQITTLRVD